MIEPLEAPSVRKIAMSERFSFTVITRVDTSPKAPTRTMRKRMIPIMRFSTCTAANHVRFCRDQSTAQNPEGRTERRRCAMTGASFMSEVFTRRPCGPPVRKSAAASSTCTTAMLESYS